MYDNLSNRLRGEAKASDASLYIKELMREAADALDHFENLTRAFQRILPVRCKDCIYISEHAFVETDEAYCSEHDWCVSEAYFCADGKRKEGDLS